MGQHSAAASGSGRSRCRPAAAPARPSRRWRTALDPGGQRGDHRIDDPESEVIPDGW